MLDIVVWFNSIVDCGLYCPVNTMSFLHPYLCHYRAVITEVPSVGVNK